MTIRSNLHATVGLAALGIALYFTFSDALVLEMPGIYLSHRTQVFTAGMFFVAGFSLLLSAWRQRGVEHTVLGYASLGIGLSVVWLVRFGSSV